MNNSTPFTPSIRQEVKSFSPYEAGLSIDEIKEKYKLDKVIKLASNENPLGVSSKVVKTLQEKASLAFRYPQSGNPRLRKALAKHLNINSNRIVLGNGSDEVIDLLIRVVAEPHKHNIVAFDPCFSIYRTQAKVCGVELRQLPLKENFHFDLENIFKLIDENTSLVFLTNPDNPSGYAIEAEKILDFAKKLPKTCLLVVDEAYIDFAEEKFSCLKYIDEIENIALLRTFSKCYGLAGLRIGYGIFPQEIADYMCRIRLPFSLNILAEEASLTALQDKDFYLQTLEVTKKGRIFLTKELTELKCKVFPSQSNFILVSLPYKDKAKELFNFLLEKGIIIRYLGSYNLPDSIRISIGTEEENTLLIKLVKEFLSLC